MIGVEGATPMCTERSHIVVQSGCPDADDWDLATPVRHHGMPLWLGPIGAEIAGLALIFAWHSR